MRLGSIPGVLFVCPLTCNRQPIQLGVVLSLYGYVTFRCLPARLPLAADNSPCRSLIWYLALDILKWFLMWALNEEGVLSKVAWKKFLRSKERPAIKTGER